MAGWSAVARAYRGARAVLGDAGKGVAFVGNNWKGVAATAGLSVAGWKYFINDESLLEQAVEVGVSKNAAERMHQDGLSGGVNHVIFGERGEGKSLSENAVDAVAGEGTYNKITEVAGDAVDGAGRAINAVGEGVSDMYHGAKDLVAGVLPGQGGQQQYVPPTSVTDYQSQAQQQYGQIPQAYMAQYYQMMQQQQQPQSSSGLFGGLDLFSGVSQLTSNILGGGKGLSLAALIPAAFLMFGNFGWMGKIASLFLGSLAMKNMRTQQVVNYQQQLPYMQQLQPQMIGIPQQQSQVQLPLQLALGTEEETTNVIRRGRI